MARLTLREIEDDHVVTVERLDATPCETLPVSRLMGWLEAEGLEIATASWPASAKHPSAVVRPGRMPRRPCERPPNSRA